MKKVECNVIEVLPKVFYFNFKYSIDIGLTFWRYQEYYESRYFKGKIMSLVDFIHSSAKKNNQEFDYFGKWEGFNIPNWVVKEVFNKIKDKNKYDYFIKNVYDTCIEKYNQFYFISLFYKSEETLLHELAHGLYTTNVKYKKDINQILNSVPKKYIKIWSKGLLKHGYNKCVHKDEIQAYLVAGQSSDLNFKNDNKYRFLVRDVFNKYSKNRVKF